MRNYKQHHSERCVDRLTDAEAAVKLSGEQHRRKDAEL